MRVCPECGADTPYSTYCCLCRADFPAIEEAESDEEEEAQMDDNDDHLGTGDDE